MTDRHDLAKATAKLLRRHRRTFWGHCRCGWRRDLMEFEDHEDHVGKLIADCLWAVLPT